MPLHKGAVIEVSRDLASSLPFVMGVEGEIRDALTNLIFNAADVMPNGGSVVVRTRVVENAVSKGRAAVQHVCVEVSDTGVGMDEETRRRCLEPFFTTKGERGTGLGLAMVYGVAQRHRAEIEIESEPGRGPTVRISFATADAEVDESVQGDQQSLPAVRQRILIVDDDPLLLRSLRAVLEADGHTVVSANGGGAGVDAFRAALKEGAPFDVVFTDLGMPYVDGRMVAKEIRAESPEVRLILLTGWGERLVVDGEIPFGVDVVLSKPPKIRKLREAMACPIPRVNRPLEPGDRQP
jgi:CheY-like chemotaxis protein/anti-sigma regulatory factor (Ser/Thr protein kinase)